MFLTVKNLSKKYSDTYVLQKINISIRKGEIISIVGASGSGKSTLLKCLSGLCDINDGDIIINSKNLKNTEPNKRNIAYLFQESPLFPHLNVLQNILFNLKKYDKNKLDILLEKTHIKHLNNRYPYEISGGENQRVAVVRSLIRNPDLFLLDEPFSNLDILTKEYVKELVFDIIKRTNTTTIIVNHDIPDSLEISDKIIVLENGEINMIESPSKVYREPKSLKIATLFGEVNVLTIKGEKIYFRPEDVDVVKKSNIQAIVIDSIFTGPHYKIVAKIRSERIIFFSKHKLVNGSEIFISFISSFNFLN